MPLKSGDYHNMTYSFTVIVALSLY